MASSKTAAMLVNASAASAVRRAVAEETRGIYDALSEAKREISAARKRIQRAERLGERGWRLFGEEATAARALWLLGMAVHLRIGPSLRERAFEKCASHFQGEA